MAYRAQKQVVSSVLAVLYFTSQVALGSATETNFWNERRKQFASLPAAPFAGQPAFQRLINQLPSVAHALPTAETKSPIRVRRKPLQSESLNALIDSIPLSKAAIQEIYDPADSKQAPVVLVQDVHMNVEAQSNIAGVIQPLIDTNRVSAVAIEGAFSKLDFAPYRAFQNKQVARDVANAFLKENLLAAPSYVGITSAKEPPAFIGVDDKKHYDANVQAYLVTRPLKRKTIDKLKKTKRELNEQKQKVYSPALLKFDDLRTAYHGGTIGLGVYLDNLSKNAEIPLVIDQFLQASHMESKLDFARVELERRAVLEKLTTKLKQSEIDSLINQSLAYRLGRISFGSYYAELRSLCERKGVALTQTPAFADYIQYVLLVDGIKANELFEEMEKLEARTLAALIAMPEQKVLADQAEFVMLGEKLIEFALTSREWDKYKTLVYSPSTIDHGLENLSPFERFYSEADIRSQKMKAALPSESAILVTGGFHTPLITEQLRKDKRPYVVVSPKITKIDDASGSAYLSVFAQEKTPLDKLFQGEKLFLKVAGQEVVPGNKLSREIGDALRLSVGNIQFFKAGDLEGQDVFAAKLTPADGVKLETVVPGKLEYFVKRPTPLQILTAPFKETAKLWLGLQAAKYIFNPAMFSDPLALSPTAWGVIVLIGFLFSIYHSDYRDIETFKDGRRTVPMVLSRFAARWFGGIGFTFLLLLPFGYWLSAGAHFIPNILYLIGVYRSWHGIDSYFRPYTAEEPKKDQPPLGPSENLSDDEKDLILNRLREDSGETPMQQVKDAFSFLFNKDQFSSGAQNVAVRRIEKLAPHLMGEKVSSHNGALMFVMALEATAKVSELMRLLKQAESMPVFREAVLMPAIARSSDLNGSFLADLFDMTASKNKDLSLEAAGMLEDFANSNKSEVALLAMGREVLGSNGPVSILYVDTQEKIAGILEEIIAPALKSDNVRQQFGDLVREQAEKNNPIVTSRLASMFVGAGQNRSPKQDLTESLNDADKSRKSAAAVKLAESLSNDTYGSKGLPKEKMRIIGALLKALPQIEIDAATAVVNTLFDKRLSKATYEKSTRRWTLALLKNDMCKKLILDKLLDVDRRRIVDGSADENWAVLEIFFPVLVDDERTLKIIADQFFYLLEEKFTEYRSEEIYERQFEGDTNTMRAVLKLRRYHAEREPAFTSGLFANIELPYLLTQTNPLVLVETLRICALMPTRTKQRFWAEFDDIAANNLKKISSVDEKTRSQALDILTVLSRGNLVNVRELRPRVAHAIRRSVRTLQRIVQRSGVGNLKKLFDAFDTLSGLVEGGLIAPDAELGILLIDLRSQEELNEQRSGRVNAIIKKLVEQTAARSQIKKILGNIGTVPDKEIKLQLEALPKPKKSEDGQGTMTIELLYKLASALWWKGTLHDYQTKWYGAGLHEGAALLFVFSWLFFVPVLMFPPATFVSYALYALGALVVTVVLFALSHERFYESAPTRGSPWSLDSARNNILYGTFTRVFLPFLAVLALSALSAHFFFPDQLATQLDTLLTGFPLGALATVWPHAWFNQNSLAKDRAVLGPYANINLVSVIEEIKRLRSHDPGNALTWADQKWKEISKALPSYALNRQSLRHFIIIYADLLVQNKQGDKAVSVIINALSVVHDDDELVPALALVYRRLNRFQQGFDFISKKARERRFKENPTPFFVSMYGTLCLDLGNAKEGIEYIEKFEDWALWNDERVRDVYAKLHAQQSDLFLLKAIKKGNSDPDLLQALRFLEMAIERAVMPQLKENFFRKIHNIYSKFDQKPRNKITDTEIKFRNIYVRILLLQVEALIQAGTQYKSQRLLQKARTLNQEARKNIRGHEFLSDVNGKEKIIETRLRGIVKTQQELPIFTDKNRFTGRYIYLYPNVLAHIKSEHFVVEQKAVKSQGVVTTFANDVLANENLMELISRTVRDAVSIQNENPLWENSLALVYYLPDDLRQKLRVSRVVLIVDETGEVRTLIPTAGEGVQFYVNGRLGDINDLYVTSDLGLYWNYGGKDPIPLRIRSGNFQKVIDDAISLPSFTANQKEALLWKVLFRGKPLRPDGAKEGFLYFEYDSQEKNKNGMDENVRILATVNSDTREFIAITDLNASHEPTHETSKVDESPAQKNFPKKVRKAERKQKVKEVMERRKGELGQAGDRVLTIAWFYRLASALWWKGTLRDYQTKWYGAGLHEGTALLLVFSWMFLLPVLMFQPTTFVGYVGYALGALVVTVVLFALSHERFYESAPTRGSPWSLDSARNNILFGTFTRIFLPFFAVLALSALSAHFFFPDQLTTQLDILLAGSPFGALATVWPHAWFNVDALKKGRALLGPNNELSDEKKDAILERLREDSDATLVQLVNDAFAFLLNKSQFSLAAQNVAARRIVKILPRITGEQAAIHANTYAFVIALESSKRTDQLRLLLDARSIPDFNEQILIPAIERDVDLRDGYLTTLFVLAQLEKKGNGAELALMAVAALKSFTGANKNESALLALGIRILGENGALNMQNADVTEKIIEILTDDIIPALQNEDSKEKLAAVIAERMSKGSALVTPGLLRSICASLTEPAFKEVFYEQVFKQDPSSSFFPLEYGFGDKVPGQMKLLSLMNDGKKGTTARSWAAMNYADIVHGEIRALDDRVDLMPKRMVNKIKALVENLTALNQVAAVRVVNRIFTPDTNYLYSNNFGENPLWSLVVSILQSNAPVRDILINKFLAATPAPEGDDPYVDERPDQMGAWNLLNYFMSVFVDDDVMMGRIVDRFYSTINNTFEENPSALLSYMNTDKATALAYLKIAGIYFRRERQDPENIIEHMIVAALQRPELELRLQAARLLDEMPPIIKQDMQQQILVALQNPIALLQNVDPEKAIMIDEIQPAVDAFSIVSFCVTRQMLPVTANVALGLVNVTLQDELNEHVEARPVLDKLAQMVPHNSDLAKVLSDLNSTSLMDIRKRLLPMMVTGADGSLAGGNMRWLKNTFFKNTSDRIYSLVHSMWAEGLFAFIFGGSAGLIILGIGFAFGFTVGDANDVVRLFAGTMGLAYVVGHTFDKDNSANLILSILIVVLTSPWAFLNVGPWALALSLVGGFVGVHFLINLVASFFLERIEKNKTEISLFAKIGGYGFLVGLLLSASVGFIWVELTVLRAVLLIFPGLFWLLLIAVVGLRTYETVIELGLYRELKDLVLLAESQETLESANVPRPAKKLLDKEFMKDLTDVGSSKALGYLPLPTIGSEEEISQIILFLHSKGLKTMVSYHQTIKGGALWVYDEKLLSEIINAHKTVLTRAGVPLEPARYVQHLVDHIVDELLANKVVAKTFADRDFTPEVDAILLKAENELSVPSFLWLRRIIGPIFYGASDLFSSETGVDVVRVAIDRQRAAAWVADVIMARAGGRNALALDMITRQDQPRLEEIFSDRWGTSQELLQQMATWFKEGPAFAQMVGAELRMRGFKASSMRAEPITATLLAIGGNERAVNEILRAVVAGKTPVVMVTEDFHREFFAGYSDAEMRARITMTLINSGVRAGNVTVMVPASLIKLYETVATDINELGLKGNVSVHSFSAGLVHGNAVDAVSLTDLSGVGLENMVFVRPEGMTLGSSAGLSERQIEIIRQLNEPRLLLHFLLPPVSPDASVLAIIKGVRDALEAA